MMKLQSSISLETHLAAVHCATRRRRRGKPRPLITVLLVQFAIMVAMAGGPALAQVSKQRSDDELAVRLQEPLAPLMSFQFYDYYEASLHDQDGTVNQAVFRGVVPFSFAGTDNIFRLTEQDTTQAYDNKLGGNDPELLYLTGSSVSWGRWGIGAVLEPPTGSEKLTSNKWSVGPSAGIEDTSDPHQHWGLFLRSYSSFAGSEKAKKVSIVNLQPLYDLTLGRGRSLSLGQSQLEYDAAEGKWKSLQFGLKFGQIFTIAAHKWQPTVEADYDFCNKTAGNAMWTIRIGITALVPEL